MIAGCCNRRVGALLPGRLALRKVSAGSLRAAPASSASICRPLAQAHEHFDSPLASDRVNAEAEADDLRRSPSDRITSRT
jgi:hypothetical protein